MDIESQPAIAGDSIKPGVKRSETPGDCPKIMPARGAGDSVYRDFRAIARPRAVVAGSAVPGVPLRSTPGFMLSPAAAG